MHRINPTLELRVVTTPLTTVAFLSKNYFSKIIIFLISALSLFALFGSKNVLGDNNDPAPLISSSFNCVPFEDDMMAPPPIQPLRSGQWNQAATWPGGVLPTLEDDVVVPEGTTLTMVGVCNARSITVNGTLRAINDRQNGAHIELQTRYIMVMGANALMEIGTEDQYYQNDIGCNITLIGNNRNEMIPGTGVNSKAIMVMNGGRLEMHGKPKKSWVKIGAQTTAGATSMTLADAVDWVVGDEVIITSNRLNPEEAEKKMITAVSANGRTISFDSALQYPRMGEVQSYSNPDNSRSWNVDTRAEVGLLSRNITIQGDNTNATRNGLGGHIMIMNGSTGNAENIELFQMGQKNILARYPWHWHLLGASGTGQYIRNSSIHTSYNRAITVHGTWGTTMDGNVAYDHIGHGIFLEDGSEIDNTFSNNLVLGTKRPASLSESLLGSDFQPTNTRQNAAPSAFWITNANNTFINNVVAGTVGTAYWFAFPDRPTGFSAEDPRFRNMRPRQTPLKEFRGNVAHSCHSGFDVNDGLNANHELTANTRWAAPGVAIMQDFTAFSNRLNIYAGIGDRDEDVVFDNLMSADALDHVMFATRHVIRNSVFIADTGNGLIGGNTTTTSMYVLYDGAGRIYDSHLVNWNRNYTRVLEHFGAASKRINHLFRGLTYNHDGPARVSQLENYTRPSQAWSNVIRDLDGSLTRTGNPSSIIVDIPFNQLSNVYKPANWNGFISVSEKFAYVRLTGYPAVTVATQDRVCNSTKVRRFRKGTVGNSQQLHLPLGADKYEHSFYLEELPGTSLRVAMESELNAGDGLLVRFRGMGTLNNVQIDGITQSPNVNAVRNSNSTAYVVTGQDLLVKFVTTDSFLGRNYTIQWNSGSLPNMTPESNVEGDCDNSDIPQVTFTQPTTNWTLTEGYDTFAVNVAASDNDGIANVRLYVENELIRQENGAPYDWGLDNDELLGLSVGVHTLRAVATDTRGNVGEASITITIENKPVTIWPFDTNNDFEGWEMNDKLTGTVTDGSFAYEIIGNDPIFQIQSISPDISSYNYVRVRLQTSADGFLECFWGKPGINASRRVTKEVKGKDDYQEVLIPVGEHDQWSDMINALRIDFQFPQGEVGKVDLIALEAEDKRDCAGIWEGTTSDNECTLSVPENGSDLSVMTMIYPVPAKESISMRFPGTSDNMIKLYNTLGQILYQTTTNDQEHTIPLLGMDKGVYFLYVSFEGVAIRKTFVKE